MGVEEGTPLFPKFLLSSPHFAPALSPYSQTLKIHKEQITIESTCAALANWRGQGAGLSGSARTPAAWAEAFSQQCPQELGGVPCSLQSPVLKALTAASEPAEGACPCASLSSPSAPAHKAETVGASGSIGAHSVSIGAPCEFKGNVP